MVMSTSTLRHHDNLKCDVCGRFVSYQDLLEGKAYHNMVTPDSIWTTETHETLCKEHKNELRL